MNEKALKVLLLQLEIKHKRVLREDRLSNYTLALVWLAFDDFSNI